MDHARAKFTCVFDRDIRKHKKNPFDEETPWGKCVTVAAYDACDLLDRYENAMSWIRDHDPDLADKAEEKFNLSYWKS